MMDSPCYKILPPERLRARIVLPASKSISNRALIINALAERCGDGAAGGQLRNVSDCDDSRVVVAALGSMPSVIDIMAAGTAMRFLSALLCVTEGEHVITGTERMRHRPISILVDALRSLGASVEYVGEEGFPPLRIRGCELRGGELSLPGGVSSQYISALLMIGATMKDGLRLRLTGGVVSRPYIDMTLAIMRQFGARAEWMGEDAVVVEPTGYVSVPYFVESDWSAASYWYEMMALSGDEEAEVVLPGLFAESLQGDSGIARLFGMLGVETCFAGDDVVLRKGGSRVERLDFDMVTMPDLAQTVVVTCCMMGVPFCLRGLQTLRIKETDRMLALQRELGKLGFVITAHDDCELRWDGRRCVPDVLMGIDTYEDHRMAMAFAPVAMCRGEVRINNPEVVSKSYPAYWEDLRRAGFSVE